MIINTADKKNIHEHNIGDENNCREIDDDSFYDDMVSKMMDNNGLRGRKRKVCSSVKKTKRFKKGKAKK